MRRFLPSAALITTCWLCTLAQTAAAQHVFEDSLDRYGAAGIRYGVFQCLNKSNEFFLPVAGPFLDYSFGRFRHSIEIDFLTRKPLRFFKNAYSPCLSYHFTVKKQLHNQMELHTGGFVNCRKDFMNFREYMNPLDTGVFKRGYHTIFSLGPSVEITRRFFIGGKSSFLLIGARIAYSFDILGYGWTSYPPGTVQFKSTEYGSQPIPARERFLRDALAFTVRAGWGKLVRNNIPKPDYTRLQE